MLGKTISMTAHALGIATIFGCALMAQHMTVSPAGYVRTAPPPALGGGDRAAPANATASALAAK